MTRYLMTPEYQAIMDEGLCTQVGGDLWFPEKGEPCKTAKELCQTCEVRTQCLSHALTLPEEFGVWGGLSASERRELLKKRWTG